MFEKLVVGSTVVSIVCSFGSLVIPRPYAAWVFLAALGSWWVMIALIALLPPPVTISHDSMEELRRMMNRNPAPDSEREKGGCR